MPVDPHFLTDFADGAVLVPVGVAVAASLAVLGQGRAAAAWAGAVGGTWALVLLLKLAGYWLAVAVPGSSLVRLDLVSPSGHVASATVIYAGLAGLAVRWPGRPATRMAATGLAVAAAIAATRVVLREHSVAEAAVGGVIGLLGVAALAATIRAPLAGWRPVPVVAAVATIVLWRHGLHLSPEGLIRRMATAAAG